MKTEPVQVGCETLSALGVNDERYANKLDQVATTPYYQLVHRQYWDYGKNRGGAGNNEGVGSSDFSVSITNGFSQTDMQSIEKTVGWEITAGVELAGKIPIPSGKAGVPAGSISTKASLGMKWSTQTTESKSSDKSESKETTYDRRVTMPAIGRKYKLITWSLVDQFSLIDHKGNTVKTWEDVNTMVYRQTSDAQLPSEPAVETKPA